MPADTCRITRQSGRYRLYLGSVSKLIDTLPYCFVLAPEPFSPAVERKFIQANTHTDLFFRQADDNVSLSIFYAEWLRVNLSGKIDKLTV